MLVTNFRSVGLVTKNAGDNFSVRGVGETTMLVTNLSPGGDDKFG